MKKTITKTITKSIEVCDNCEGDCSHGFANHCYICGGQFCFRCSRFVDYANEPSSDNRILELPVHVCCRCEEVGGVIPGLLAEHMRCADISVCGLIRDWKERAKAAAKQATLLDAIEPESK